MFFFPLWLKGENGPWKNGIKEKSKRVGVKKLKENRAADRLEKFSGILGRDPFSRTWSFIEEASNRYWDFVICGRDGFSKEEKGSMRRGGGMEESEKGNKTRSFITGKTERRSFAFLLWTIWKQLSFLWILNNLRESTKRFSSLFFFLLPEKTWNREVLPRKCI